MDDKFFTTARGRGEDKLNAENERQGGYSTDRLAMRDTENQTETPTVHIPCENLDIAPLIALVHPRPPATHATHSFLSRTSGQIPQEIVNLTLLEKLFLGQNRLNGERDSCHTGACHRATQPNLVAERPDYPATEAGRSASGNETKRPHGPSTFWGGEGRKTRKTDVLSPENLDTKTRTCGNRAVVVCLSGAAGPIPTEIGKLKNLRLIFLQENQLRGEPPEKDTYNAVEKIQGWLRPPSTPPTSRSVVETGSYGKQPR